MARRREESTGGGALWDTRMGAWLKRHVTRARGGCCGGRGHSDGCLGGRGGRGKGRGLLMGV